MKLKKGENNQYNQISLYVIGTAVAIFILYRAVAYLPAVLKAITTGIGIILGLLVPVFWGFFIAYLLTPLVDFLEGRLKKAKRYKEKNARRPAVLISYLLVIAFVSIILSLLISTFTSQLQVVSLESSIVAFENFISNIQAFIQSISDKLASMNIDNQELNSLAANLSKLLGDGVTALGNFAVNSIGNISGFLSKGMFAIIFSVYFLLDGKNIQNYWGNVFTVLFGKKSAHYGNIFLKDADRVFSGYIRGQIIDALLMAVLISASLMICRVNYAVVIGVLAGLGNLIPYVGPFVAYTLTVLVCLVNGELGKLVLAIVLLFVVQTIDGNIINPKLLGNNINIHPMYVVIALIIGGSLGGLLGMLFGVPVAALIKVEFDKLIQYIKVKKEKEVTIKEN